MEYMVYHLSLDLACLVVLLLLVFSIMAVGHTGPGTSMSSHEIVWARHWTVNAVIGLFGLLCLLAPLMFGMNPYPHKPGGMPALILLDCLYLCFGIVLVRLSAAQSFYFDLDCRSYQYTEKMLFYSREVSGDFDEIAGLYVVYGNKAGWLIRISWNPTSRIVKSGLRKPPLERGMSQTQAEAIAQRLAAVLGVPVISNPQKHWWRNGRAGGL